MLFSAPHSHTLQLDAVCPHLEQASSPSSRTLPHLVQRLTKPDLLTNLERVGDHCNNIATEIIDDFNYDNRYFHKTKRHASDDEGYDALYRDYSLKYGNLV